MDITKSFKEFSSIDNPGNKHISQLQKYGHMLPSNEWVAMEKIHGANFSFITLSRNEQVISKASISDITNGVDIICAKRSGKIGENENFYNSSFIRDKYKSDIVEVHNRIKLDNPDTTSVQIYGELFGGYYPGFPQKQKPIQKGVYYNHEIDFLVFDIRMNTCLKIPTYEPKSDGKSNECYYAYYLAQDEVDLYLKDLPLLRGIPVKARGHFETIITMSPVFMSGIPDLYGLPPIDKNMAEGWVFKTNKRHPCHWSRPIIKSKNSTFGEIARIPRITTNFHTTNKFVDQAIPYCTQNRFNNTVSKIGLDSRIEKIRGIYVADVLKDFGKDLESDDDREEFNKTIKSVKEGINGYLLNEQCIDKWMAELLEPAGP